MRLLTPCLTCMALMTLFLSCGDGRTTTGNLRDGIANFYSFEYFERYFRDTEERHYMATPENHAEFVDFAEEFYRQRLDQRDLDHLAAFFNSRAAEVLRDLVVEGRENDPLWEFYRMKVTEHAGGNAESSNSLREAGVHVAGEIEPGPWSCPLHPNFRAHREGRCGICGMELRED